ncbi:MAG: FMN-binding protein [Methylococcaceae bacterium]|nr:FMN-binding protein [Methylococcaceae bacterium]
MRKTTNIFFLIFLTFANLARATVYYSKEEAFELAFGKGAEVEATAVFLTDEQAAQIERGAQVKLDSKLYSLHVGKRGGQVLGYAAIESHNVRTQPETVMILLSPTGELNRVEMLAFHEPPEYQPPARWFEKLYRRPLEELRPGQGVDGISGATLSSRASLDGIRKVMAIYRVALKEEKNR